MLGVFNAMQVAVRAVVEFRARLFVAVTITFGRHNVAQAAVVVFVEDFVTVVVVALIYAQQVAIPVVVVP